MVNLRCRRYLTLLETLLVIFLLGLFLGLIGINVNKAVHEQRFSSEVSSVVDTLRIAQYIMLILDNDVHVKFQQGDKGIALDIETACPLSENWTQIILKQKILRTIHIINFKDRLTNAASEEGVVDIRFLSSGYVMSQGIMRLATANAIGDKQGLENFICLPGYPNALHSQTVRPDDSECFALLNEGFVAEMTTVAVNEIKALEAAKKSNEPQKNESGLIKEPEKNETKATK